MHTKNNKATGRTPLFRRFVTVGSSVRICFSYFFPVFFSAALKEFGIPLGPRTA